MASSAGLSRKDIGAFVAVSIGAIAVAYTGKLDYKSLKSLLQSMLTGPGSTSRIVAILVVLANLKSFPLVWHVRVLGAFFKHLRLSTHKFSPTGNGPSSLFQPTISTTRSPISECDYNIHKSNSTYFSDLDVSRSNIMCVLLREGMHKLYHHHEAIIGPDGAPASGKWTVALGATHCSFKRQIAPYEAYEMWSRILCWDRKWIYVVTHFVKKGAVKPAGYSLQPPWSYPFASFFGRNKALTEGATQEESTMGTVNGAVLEPKAQNKVIFASAISKYVCKIGRLTAHPEVVFEASGLLPPKPGGWNTMSGIKPLEKTEDVVNGHNNGHASVSPSDSADLGEWDWKRVEAENARGMEYAQHFAALDGLDDAFTGGERPALGAYYDFL